MAQPVISAVMTTTRRTTRWWTSDATKARYPVAWQLRIPALKLESELPRPSIGRNSNCQPFAYWEGMVDFRGTRDGQPLSGEGYMELTGYAAAHWSGSPSRSTRPPFTI
jgi:predicted secreted hydrolase